MNQQYLLGDWVESAPNSRMRASPSTSTTLPISWRILRVAIARQQLGTESAEPWISTSESLRARRALRFM